MTVSGLALKLVPGPQAPDEARQEVTRLLRGSFAPAFIDDASLMTSELVTNSVRHVDHEPGDTIRVEANVSEQGFRLEVQDSGPGYEWDGRERIGDRGSGWGLAIVNRTADRWGVLHNPTRTWFELDTRSS